MEGRKEGRKGERGGRLSDRLTYQRPTIEPISLVKASPYIPAAMRE